MIEYLIGAGTIGAAALASKFLQFEQAQPTLKIHHRGDEF